ncbi:MAG: hypothetical protein QW327_05560 [Candidatus Odinarchaeota archaeon]
MKWENVKYRNNSGGSWYTNLSSIIYDDGNALDFSFYVDEYQTIHSAIQIAGGLEYIKNGGAFPRIVNLSKFVNQAAECPQILVGKNNLVYIAYTNGANILYIINLADHIFQVS